MLPVTRYFLNSESWLTVEHLNASDVIPVQPEVDAVAGVERSHQGAAVLRVTQAKGVANLMGSHDPQISAIVGTFGPDLILVEVDDARIWWFSVSKDVTCGRNMQLLLLDNQLELAEDNTLLSIFVLASS